MLAIAHSGDVHLLTRLGLTSLCIGPVLAVDGRLSFVSQQLRDRLISELGTRSAARLHSRVCPMGVDVARFQRCRPSRRLPGPWRILVMGRLVPVKGVDVAIRAMTLVKADAELIIAGSGPLQSALHCAAQGDMRIQFVGEVRGQDRDQLLAAADVLLIPSRVLPNGRSEGLPVTALEALASEVPVIASAVGGLSELESLVGNQQAWEQAIRLVAADDPIALAAAIETVLGCPEARNQQTSAGKNLVARLDWNYIGRELWSQLTAEACR